MELRKLVSKDIFPMCGILKKIGIKELKGAINGTNIIELASDSKKVNPETITLDIILDVVGIIITNLPQCEKELYAFLESIIVVDDEAKKTLRKDLENMPIDEFAQLIKDVISKEEFRDFFKVALKSSK